MTDRVADREPVRLTVLVHADEAEHLGITPGEYVIVPGEPIERWSDDAAWMLLVRPVGAEAVPVSPGAAPTPAQSDEYAFAMLPARSMIPYWPEGTRS